MNSILFRAKGYVYQFRPVMLPVFIKLTNNMPIARPIHDRSSSALDGRRIPPLWVRYLTPMNHNRPHDRADSLATLYHLGEHGVRHVRHRSGAIYTFWPWIPTRSLPQIQGERTPWLRSQGLSDIFKDT